MYNMGTVLADKKHITFFNWIFYRFGKNVKIVHFIGATKPWLIHFDGKGEPQIGYFFIPIIRVVDKFSFLPFT